MTHLMNKTPQITRRTVAASLLLATLSPGSFLLGEQSQTTADILIAIEKKSGGRLGYAMLDTATGKSVSHRATERFPMCSTFKFLAAALILQRVEKGIEHLDRKVVFSTSDLVTYSPITEKRTGPNGMTIAELCLAAITMSDNTAANLLLASFGGPPALTQFLRSIGDPVTRLDRNETTLNEAKPGDPRDTTTPSAMLNNMHNLLLGDILSPASRDQLTQWLLKNTTGKARLQAGIPTDWKEGDKTGSGDNGTTNDIAILWPPNRAPILVAAYLTESPLSADGRNAILAEIGRVTTNFIHPA
jgi:beta-lactamase class A